MVLAARRSMPVTSSTARPWSPARNTGAILSAATAIRQPHPNVIMMAHTTPSHPRGADLTDRVGGTPLVPIRGLANVPAGVEVLGKAEWLNPGGSVKDRAALAIVRAAERTGALRPGGTILDATSGNTGIA